GAPAVTCVSVSTKPSMSSRSPEITSAQRSAASWNTAFSASDRLSSQNRSVMLNLLSSGGGSSVGGGGGVAPSTIRFLKKPSLGPHGEPGAPHALVTTTYFAPFASSATIREVPTPVSSSNGPCQSSFVARRFASGADGSNEPS